MSSPSSVILPSTRHDGDGVVHPVQAAQEGGLAAARRADEGGHRLVEDIDIDILQRVVLPVIDLHARGRRSWWRWCPRLSPQVACRSWHAPPYQRRSKRRRSTMATAFMITKEDQQHDDRARGPFDEGRVAARCPGVDLHRQGGGGVEQALQRRRRDSRRTKATMPISSSGAVSPSAWARPMIVPVRMPGIGQRQHMVEHRLHLRRADAQRRIADRRRHRLQRRAGRR